jgi:hypothetical protein
MVYREILFQPCERERFPHQAGFYFRPGSARILGFKTKLRHQPSHQRRAIISAARLNERPVVQRPDIVTAKTERLH